MNDRSRGDRYAISALRNRRATLASEIIQLERQVRARKDALGHVDACLRLLDPSIEIDAIRPKRPPQRIKLFRQGELGRMILDALRQAGGEASVAEITSALLEAGGHGEAARRTVAGRVRGNLAYLERRGKVSKHVRAAGVRWALLSP